MKHKRVWTDEQRRAAAERMRAAQKVRWEKAKQVENVNSGEYPMAVVATMEKIRAPEVQAVLDTMTPERKAKLASVQLRQWAVDAQTDKATREALQRHEAEKSWAPILSGPPKIIPPVMEVGASFIPTTPVSVVTRPVHPFRFTSGGNGLMVSELGVCLCGMQKLKWHPICLSR